MSERIGDPTFQEYNLVNNNGYGGQSYNINEDAAQSLGPVRVTPSGLADLDNRMNAEWWAKQGQQQGATQPTTTSPEQPVVNQSIGERASDPTFNNGAEGEKLAERVRRGYQRANYARAQTAEGQREQWANEPDGAWRSYPKCNEFVYSAHTLGDPKGSGFPNVGRLKFWQHMPTVDKLADPSFRTDVLEYHPSAGNIWPGDTVVWYGNGNHHSGIALGNGEVAYASTYGAKTNTIEDANARLSESPPIIRRFK